MQFISREKSPSYVFRHGEFAESKGLAGGMRVKSSPLYLQFEALVQPFETTLLPAKGASRHAWGLLDTTREAQRLRKQSGFYVEEEDKATGETRDITEDMIIEFLYEHPDYGIEFIGIGSGGEELDSKDRWLVPEGDPAKGGRYCRLCRQHIPNAQGVDGHVASGKHQANLEKELGSDTFTLKLVG